MKDIGSAGRSGGSLVLIERARGGSADNLNHRLILYLRRQRHKRTADGDRPCKSFLGEKTNIGGGGAALE